MKPNTSTLTGRLAEFAAHRPGAVAVIDRGIAVTFRDLDLLAGRMAAWLARQGLHPGDMVALTLREELPHLVASLGLMRLGCDQVALPSQDTIAMRAEIAARAGACALVADRREDALEGIGLLLPDHAAIAADGGLAGAPPPGRGPDGTTILLTGSGTTGRPKLIPLSERIMCVRGPLSSGGVSVRHLPVAIEFPQARRQIFVSLAAGGRSILANNGRELGIIDLCGRFGVEHLTLSPRRTETLLAEAARGGGSARLPARTRLSVTGATVPAALRRRVLEDLTQNLEVPYGATEVGGITRAQPEDHARHPDGVGRAAPGSEVVVVNDRGVPVPAGAAGFVRVRTEGLVPGYFDDPVATAGAFLPDGWFQPGDIAVMTDDGTLMLAGRGDDMMILGTINVFPAEIERAAAGFPGLADCAAFAYRSDALGDIPMIAAVETHAGTLDAGALVAHCRARLGLRAPRKAIIVPVLPRNAAGKVLRRELTRIAAAEIKVP
jgi:acyl-CoA synthetase (AMP-forming)/AMP-acid ligase II